MKEVMMGREPFEKHPLGRPRSKLEFNNEVDLKEVVRM
jgi:hypothetical protein